MQASLNIKTVNPKFNKISNQLIQIYNDDNQLQNCTYLLVDENKVLIIDPSFIGDFLIEFIQKNNLEVVGIFLTHGHWDHWIYARSIIEYTKLPIYCHKADQPVLENGLARIHSMDPSYDPKQLINDLVVYQNWKDHDVIEIDNFRLRVLHTPGHSPGSVCFSFDDYVFSGDHVFATTIGRTDLYLSDPMQMKTSLQKFFKNFCKCQMILPGHLDKHVRVCDAYKAISSNISFED
ncbi:hydroxyacylglutathione hydrolase [Mycoplasmoides fastidiosum]|uniref:Hydroxyacylglutathione hydrolase n=1 Tax=Mycoplasmoides fastidiosum TaxID=92758 RepID=A0ABU0LZ19_9BACT|nr:MBL fold metallo-hydrolase [Mycoplasmoides fastidiosum]MDQ0513951.1 hydroxyacylglutathione hydrolase [Mycoplasmoides fastidiosum]UUD37635.1 MBL fold metallo-hydrolase [Mycoplasmoides fastidiosum]